MSEREIQNEFCDYLGARYEQLARVHNAVEIILSRCLSVSNDSIEPDSSYQLLRAIERIADREIIENLQKRNEIKYTLSQGLLAEEVK